jgi:hypothetical protein
MQKSTFYFSHDYNAHNDVKILFLRQQLGMEGYGIYWFLIESLADSGGILPMKVIPVLAMQMQTSEVKVEGVIRNYELFEVAEEQFCSSRLLEHLHLRKTLSENGKKGAEKRWINGGANGGAIAHPNGEGYAKERKGKEIKENVIEQKLTIKDSNLFRQPVIPTKEQVWEVFSRNQGTKEMAKAFWEKYEAVGWFANNNPITNFVPLAQKFISTWQKIESAKKTKPQEQDPTKIKIVLK